MSLTTKNLKKLSEIFDADYYERGVEAQKSNYYDYYLPRIGGQFSKTATHIKQHFNPLTLLDVGCAKGFLVYYLRQLGVEAYGIDASEYATSSAPEEIRDYISMGMAEKLPYGKNSFDVVTALDVLEHLSEKDASKACKKILEITSKYVVVCVPTRHVDGDLDITHRTIKPKEWWEEQFTKSGGIILPVEEYFDAGVWWFNIPEFLIVVKK